MIITCARHLEPETKEEIIKILGEMGDSEPEVVITSMSGILTVKTNLDSVEVVRKMKELVEEEPWSLRYCLRVIPIQKVSQTNKEDIEKITEELIPQIFPNESYRISIEKRNSDISSQELITNIAQKIKNKVSLEHPDKVIQIEILGAKTGVSVIKRSDVLSVEKVKRSLSE